MGSVVAHDEILVGAEGVEFEVFALASGGEVGFFDWFAINVGDTQDDGHGFAGEADYTLDEGPVRVQGVVEDDDIAPLGAAAMEGVDLAEILWSLLTATYWPGSMVEDMLEPSTLKFWMLNWRRRNMTRARMRASLNSFSCLRIIMD